MMDLGDIEAKAGICDSHEEWSQSPTEATLKEASVRDSEDETLHTRSASRLSRIRQWAVFQKISAWFSQDEEHPTQVRKLQECPRGYPMLAAFLDSDDNFMIYRRFGYAQSRLLLQKQAEVHHIERALEELDLEEQQQQHKKLMRAYDPDAPGPRSDLMKMLERKFLEYTTIFNAAKELTSTSRPSHSEYKSLRNFLLNEGPLCSADVPMMTLKEDMVTLRRGREHAWLDDAIEHLLKRFNCRVVKNLFCSEETRRKSDGPEVYYTRSRIERLVSGIITATILGLLIAPIYTLYHLTQDKVSGPHTTAISISTFLVFTLAFSIVLWFFTSAKRHEILAAAAAYCAVLVVFLGNVQIVYPKPANS